MNRIKKKNISGNFPARATRAIVKNFERKNQLENRDISKEEIEKITRTSLQEEAEQKKCDSGNLYKSGNLPGDISKIEEAVEAISSRGMRPYKSLEESLEEMKGPRTPPPVRDWVKSRFRNSR